MTDIHPNAVVHKDVRLAEDVQVGPNCVIEKGVSIGAGTVLEANVVIYNNVKIGENNRFFANCVIGGRPQILGMSDDAKLGGLVIGDNNTIREQVTIHPSIYKDKLTKLGNDNLLMIGVHIGHDLSLIHI